MFVYCMFFLQFYILYPLNFVHRYLHLHTDTYKCVCVCVCIREFACMHLMTCMCTCLCLYLCSRMIVGVAVACNENISSLGKS